MMEKSDVLVLGGGPAGLSAAYTLQENGVDAVVCDKNAQPGGLCRSFRVGEYTFDTFAHVNFCKDAYVMSMLEGKTACLTHAPEAFNYSKGTWIRNPVQNNLIHLEVAERIQIIQGFLERKEFVPDSYDGWLRRAYGDYFTEHYPAAYTRKYWTVNPAQLETRWIEGRMYTPTIAEILRGAMSEDTPNVHYSKQIAYPCHGGFGSFLDVFSKNANVISDKELTALHVKTATAVFSDGEKVAYQKLISTIPLDCLIHAICDVEIPQNVVDAVAQLDYTSGVMVSVCLNKQHHSPSLWFYIYDEDIFPARVYCPDIKSPNNVPAGCSAMQAEIYFSKYRPLTHSLEEIGTQTVEQLIAMGLFAPEDVETVDVRTEKYANIMFTKEIYTARETIHAFLDSLGILWAGRFGEWDYLWLGQSILSGKKAAEKLCWERREK